MEGACGIGRGPLFRSGISKHGFSAKTWSADLGIEGSRRLRDWLVNTGNIEVANLRVNCSTHINTENK